jgi:hypothetical protein
MLRKFTTLCLGLACLSAPLWTAQAAEKRFALVVGYNHSDDPNLKRLRYADDDAMRYAAFFKHTTDHTVVLTEMDRETRRLMGKKHVGAPTRDGIIASLKQIKHKMDAARAQGHTPILYFAYSGHGNYDAEGRGYVHLKGSRFTTRDLYYHLFNAFRRDSIILIVDACNAALLVNSRGVVKRRLARKSRLNLENYPNVGVILASNSVGKTHEWGRYLAGIFSHEIRSGLLGPADLNGDRKITFAELAAFISAANAHVKNPIVRVNAYIRPPVNKPNLALVDMTQARFPVQVRVDHRITGKAHVVDSDLIRYVDFHKSSKQSFWLALTSRKPFVIVHGENEYVIPAGSTGRLTVADLKLRKRTSISARGAGSNYFERTLFHQTFDTQYAKNYLSQDYLDSLSFTRTFQLAWYKNKKAWVVLAAGIAGLGTATGFQFAGYQSGLDSQQTAWADERHHHLQVQKRHQTTASILYGVGGAAIIGSILWFALDRPTRTERYQAPFEVQLLPGGISLRATL